MMISTLSIVDNHTLFCEGLKSLFSNNPDFQIVNVYSNANDCLCDIPDNCPDILLVDYFLQNEDSISLISQIINNKVNCKIVYLSENIKTSDIIKAYDLNINGYISKSVDFQTFISILKNILSGEDYFEPDKLPAINRELLIRDSHMELLNKLTKREKVILTKVAEGMSNMEIAIECQISERTVKNHLSSIFQKIKVVDRTQAAIFAIKTNLVQI